MKYHLLLYLVIAAMSFAVMSNESLAVDNYEKREAGESYEALMKKFKGADGTQQLKMEEYFIDLLSIIPNDIKKMCYDTFRLEAVSMGGAYPKFKEIRHSHCMAYLPNKMIAKIRTLAPPKPVLAAWRDVSGKVVRFSLNNMGGTRLENIKLILSAEGMQDISKTRGSLMPGQSWTSTFRVHPSSGRLRLHMEEKYHFSPLAVDIY